MARSVKKGPYVDENLLKKIKNLKPGGREIVKTWTRDCAISPEMVGFTFGVYNGREFIEVQATEEMVGHKLGEFSPTTKFSRHGGRMQRELESTAEQKEADKQKAVAATPKAPAAKK